LAIAIVGIILASTVVVLAFTDDDGAPDAEAATRDLLAAVQANDLLGVLELLPPGERKVLRDGAPSLATQLQQVGLLTSSDLRHVEGPTTEVSGLLLRTTGLAKDMDAVDLIGGTIVFRLPAGGAPLTDHARRDLETYGDVQVDPAGVTVTRDLAAHPMRVVAIREGGGWHVSVAYSVAEWIRSSAGAEFPTMGKGPPSIGAKTPDEVVVDLLNAYANGDAERVVTVMYPNETRALYDYAPAFLPGAKERAAKAAANGTYDVQLNDVETVVEGTGSTRTVRVTSFDIEIRDELKKAHLTYDGRCLHLDHRIGENSEPYEKWDSCNNDLPKPGDPTMPRENPVLALSIFGGGVDLPAFVVVERGGRWFLSPAQTLLDSVVSTLRGQSTDAVDAFAQRLADSLRARGGDGLTGAPIEGPPPSEGSEPPDDDALALAKTLALVDACGRLNDGPRAGEVEDACLRQLVESGRIDSSFVPNL